MYQEKLIAIYFFICERYEKELKYQFLIRIITNGLFVITNGSFVITNRLKVITNELKVITNGLFVITNRL